MERKIDCFQAQNRISYFLNSNSDTSPINPNIPNSNDPDLQEASAHLKTCQTCSDRLDHYQTIVQTIGQMPKVPLPAEMRQNPTSSTLPLGETFKINLRRWERFPWYLRSLLEGLGVVLLVMVVISSAPRVRQFFEHQLERTLNDFRDEEGKEEAADSGESAALAKSRPAAAESAEDDLDGEADASATSHKGRTELWRFTLKTVSPDELKVNVVELLDRLKVQVPKEIRGGQQVPGGIEFDLIVPNGIPEEVKVGLQKLLGPNANEKDFSWYRVRSKQKLPEGHSKIVIWLAQPNQ